MTQKTHKVWTQQDVFNLGWEHFVVRGKNPCRDPNTKACRYRSFEDGNPEGCLIGLVLIEEGIEYEREWEGHRAASIRERLSADEWLVPELQPEELNAMQLSLHDNISSIDDPEEEYRRYAERHDLVVPKKGDENTK